jgi:uncharacterized metal-binding protein
VRYEPMMRPESENGGAELCDRVGAVMNEIAALLDERRTSEILRAREALADAHCEATQRRRARRVGPNDAALTRHSA